MKIIICKPLESGETNVKMSCTKEERRVLEDLEGFEINVYMLRELINKDSRSDEEARTTAHKAQFLEGCSREYDEIFKFAGEQIAKQELEAAAAMGLPIGDKRVSEEKLDGIIDTVRKS